ncbi:DUF3179 domain-containing (seleno)protein [Halorarum salinum]|uniref:DUF3179 domain-containing protein n=1 Tax=Halorarum salinum TaxID=2743089 RepID=A0A7D5QJ99_9EURY|nr:DUF3179 domain-containing (seleno)protein [Halobaculum salinum]QLG64163.1 DUF3179 domain-containing protein [Halobaculum salinum]
MSSHSDARLDDLDDLVDRLLVRDADEHAAAVEELAEAGDERVVPHLLELLVIDAIANDWERFGFPEVLRKHSPPRYLELPEVRWPGVRDALAALAEPDFDSPHAWVEWESWYSQQGIEPLAGFDEWKLRLYRSYLPPVGGLLDAEPRSFDLQDVRWGNCDRSFLAALNAPDFVPGDAVDASGGDASADGDGTDDATAAEHDGSTDDAAGTGDEYERYLKDGDTVFGFELGGVAYAVPRWVLFPHELLNAVLEGVPVSLTYCTLCNAPILYDRRVGGSTAAGGDDDRDVLTFGSSGMLASGNKVMYDEETETLWDQHAGVPIAGDYLAEDPDLVLDVLSVTQTTWGEWKDEYPDTLALDVDTGYDFDYSHYDGELGIFRHYWENGDVVQPGVRREEGELPEKAEVYGVVGDEASEVWVVPRDALADMNVVTGEAAGREVVAFLDATDDVAVYEAPPTPVELVADGLRDAEGDLWAVHRNELHSQDGETRERVVGRHGLWFAFRTHYDRATVLR